MPDLVVGLGEVGEPLRQLLGAMGHDLTHPTPYTGRIDTLHIAYPYSTRFLDTVAQYQTAWAPSLTIIHSTVPIGTTRQIPNAVHSPMNGRHGSIMESLRWLPKWVGGPRANEARVVLEKAGMTCFVTPLAETTEALKLLCLAKYGAANALARMGQELGIPDALVLEWDRAYNSDVEKGLQRPLLTADGPVIGGHCVIPGVALLRATFPHPLLTGILCYAPNGPFRGVEDYLRGL